MDQNANPTSCPLGEIDCPQFERIDQLNSEIHKLYREIEALSQQVHTDSLTGLHNRRQMLKSLNYELERTRRTRLPTSLMIIDVDLFKRVNDRYGHLIGDRALLHIASTIRSAVRKLDIPCRFGGEEFAIILPSTPLSIALQVAERIRSAIADSPLVCNELQEPLALSASIGISASTQVAIEKINKVDAASQQMLKEADAYLYQAKSRGRNCVCHPDLRLNNTENAPV